MNRFRNVTNETVANAHFCFATSEPAEALVDRLITRAPGDFDRVYFVYGGSGTSPSRIRHQHRLPMPWAET